MTSGSSEPTLSILDLVEAAWAAEEHRERLGHYASELESCRRQLYYKWTGTPPSDPIEPTGYWRLKMGDSIHGLIQSVLQARPELQAQAEVPWSIQWPGLVYPIRGRVDVLLTDPATGEQVVVEIKTTYGRGVRAIKEEGAGRYLAQVAMYLAALPQVARAHLVIVGRDDADRCELVVRRRDDGAVLERVYGQESWPTGEVYKWDDLYELIARLRQVEEAVSWKELPPRDFHHHVVGGILVEELYDRSNKIRVKSDWQCRYCQWRQRCWLQDTDAKKKEE